jgi:hypothetical protein
VKLQILASGFDPFSLDLVICVALIAKHLQRSIEILLKCQLLQGFIYMVLELLCSLQENVALLILMMLLG